MTISIDWRLVLVMLVIALVVIIKAPTPPPQRETTQLGPGKPIRRKPAEDDHDQEASEDSSAPAEMAG